MFTTAALLASAMAAKSGSVCTAAAESAACTGNCATPAAPMPPANSAATSKPMGTRLAFMEPPGCVRLTWCLQLQTARGGVRFQRFCKEKLRRQRSGQVERMRGMARSRHSQAFQGNPFCLKQGNDCARPIHVLAMVSPGAHHDARFLCSLNNGLVVAAPDWIFDELELGRIRGAPAEDVGDDER